MKMTYLKRTNQQGKKDRKVTSVILACLVLVFVLHSIFPSLYARMLSPFASLAWKTESSSLGFVGRVFSMIHSKYALILEIESLNREIHSRDTVALLVDTLRTENENLKVLLDRPSDGKDVLGVVLSRPPISMYDTLIVDVGIDEGVKVGDRVYVDSTVLVGDIAEVNGNTSKVSLFSTPGREVSVLVGSSTVEVLALGEGGGNFGARLPAEIVVHIGDSIVLPQLRSHVFGIVGEIEVDSTNSLQTILFKAPINMHEIRYVEVETKP